MRWLQGLWIMERKGAMMRASPLKFARFGEEGPVVAEWEGSAIFG